MNNYVHIIWVSLFFTLLSSVLLFVPALALGAEWVMLFSFLSTLCPLVST